MKNESGVRLRVLVSAAPWIVFYIYVYLFYGLQGLILYRHGIEPYINPDFAVLSYERIPTLLLILLTLILVVIPYKSRDRRDSFRLLVATIASSFGIMFVLEMYRYSSLFPSFYFGLPFFGLRVLTDLAIMIFALNYLYRRGWSTPMLVFAMITLVPFMAYPMGFPFIQLLMDMALTFFMLVMLMVSVSILKINFK
jgi:hypothetical protein